MEKPEWLRVPYNNNINNNFVTELLSELNLNTVCDEAACPNRFECYSKKTATFLIMGTECTRNCAFCNINHGIPEPIDKHEPERIANAVLKLGLKYVVITSVTRDDLPDGGASQFADVINYIRKVSYKTGIEVLIPDLSVLNPVTESLPDVIGHNLETVESLYSNVRPEADYYRSLDVIRNIKKANPQIRTKSGMMLGLGETGDEVKKAFTDLLDAGCEILTLGQYLSPSKNHYPVFEYIEPRVFAEYGETAKKMGFRHVASAPFVRSSYNAGDVFEAN